MWMRRSWSSWGLRLRRLIDDPICGSDFSPVARLAGCCRSPDMEISWQQDDCIRDTDLGVCRFGGSIVICSRDTGLVDRNGRRAFSADGDWHDSLGSGPYDSTHEEKGFSREFEQSATGVGALAPTIRLGKNGL